MNEDNFTQFFPNPRDKMGYLFWQINMLWIRKVNQNLEDVDLTHAQMVTLAATTFLNEKQEEVNQKDLVAAIKIDRMMISKLVTKLEKRGFLERSASKKDSRAISIKPTKQGRLKIKEAFPVMMQTDQEFFGETNQEKQELLTLLQNLLDKVEEQMNVQKI